MIKYAQIIVSTGEVVCIVDVQTPSSYEENVETNGIMYKILSNDIDNSTFAQTNYWRNNQWNTRLVKPSINHVWVNFEWVKDLTLFWENIRYERNSVLSRSDWTQLPDSGLSDDTKTAWQTYRQALRNLPSTYSSAESEEDITWPSTPA